MNQSSNPQSQQVVYGFFCQETNTFYACKTEEEYQQILAYMQTSNAQPDPPQLPQMMS